MCVCLGVSALASRKARLGIVFRLAALLLPFWTASWHVHDECGR
jgi:hypothetical protein